MTRKDYVKVAGIVAAARVRLQQPGISRSELVDYFETELADLFAADNPRFDRERFAAACAEKAQGNENSMPTREENALRLQREVEAKQHD